MNNPFKFGKSSPTSLADMAGPNRVAYEPNIPTYYAGGNTTNFLTGLPYRPEQCPTTSIQPDPWTRNGWLSDGPNLVSASGHANGARTYTHKGLAGFGRSGKVKFGNMAGPQIVANTLPARLTTGRSDAAYANFGKYHAKVTLGKDNRVSVKRKGKFSKKKTLDYW